MASFGKKFVLALSKTVETGKLDKHGKKEKERVQVGFAAVPYPTLADFGITAEFEKDDKGNVKLDDNGVAVYAQPHFDWLQSAVIGEVSARVRNYFVGGIKPLDTKENKTRELQPDAGKMLPIDFDTLTAETARTGEALKLRREAKADFEAYLQGLNKPAAVVQALGELFYNSAKVLGSASPKYIEALGMHSENWTKGLTPEKTARFAPKLVELGESLNAAIEKEELELM